MGFGREMCTFEFGSGSVSRADSNRVATSWYKSWHSNKQDWFHTLRYSKCPRCSNYIFPSYFAAFRGEKWKTNVLLTALLCPGFVSPFPFPVHNSFSALLSLKISVHDSFGCLQHLTDDILTIIQSCSGSFWYIRVEVAVSWVAMLVTCLF